MVYKVETLTRAIGLGALQLPARRGPPTGTGITPGPGASPALLRDALARRIQNNLDAGSQDLLLDTVNNTAVGMRKGELEALPLKRAIDGSILQVTQEGSLQRN